MLITKSELCQALCNADININVSRKPIRFIAFYAVLVKQKKTIFIKYFQREYAIYSHERKKNASAEN